MENWQKAWIAALLAVVLTLTGFGFGMMFEQGRSEGGSGDGATVIVDAYEKIIARSEDAPSEEALTRGAIRGMIRVLQTQQDPYANFYSPTGDADVREVTEGEFSGIGVSLTLADNSLQVERVLPKSPALKEGIEAGDILRKVNGRKVTVEKSPAIIDRIKGPPGTKVRITVQRGERMIDFVLKRASLELPNVTARMTKAGNAYLRVFGFANGAARQTREELEKLLEQGAKGVILDLRNNPGGLLVEGINVASLFLEEGKGVVIYRNNDGDEETYPAETDGEVYDEIPLVVLVNSNSASASEILAGAIQDHDRAQVVGTQTFGKGKVQDVVELLDESSVKLTVAAYLTPDGRDIDGKGITPDVVIEDPAAQFRRAQQILSEASSGGGEG